MFSRALPGRAHSLDSMSGVIAILVARAGDDGAERALATQTRPPDGVVVMSAGASLRRVASAAPPSDWLWILPADARPAPDALARLLAAVEVAPSVVIAGPKLVDRDDPSLLRSFGESLTRLGATLPLADDELDQSQHDVEDDVLGVALPGMLVRRSTWVELGGVDPGLATYDAGLDLSVRARLAGGRVARVPGARVAVAEGVQDFLRRRPLPPGARPRARRQAELHRRLVYAPALAVPLHVVALLPLALVRAVGQLLAKRPGSVPGEFAAALATLVDGTVPGARVALRRGRRLGWSALATLRIPPDVARERRASAREREAARDPHPPLVRASFFPGGMTATVVAGLLGLAAGARVLGADALEGGALRPLTGSVSTLWGGITWGPRDALGLTGPADPFAGVLAVLGSLTAWNPSLALLLLWVAAPALAALGAWWAATRLSPRAAPPALAALLWALAPPLLAALADGRPGAVLAHLLLPWLVLAAIEAPRSWSAAGAAGLLALGVGASAPTLVPVLLVAGVAWALTHPRALGRLLAIPVPLVVVAAPLAVAQALRGTPLAVLADPGPVVASASPTGWQLLLGLPSSTDDGWIGLVGSLGLPPMLGTLVPAVLLAPLAALALLGLFLPGSRRVLVATLVALAGLLTAVAAAHLLLAADGALPVTPWPGAALSLYWAGLVAAAGLTVGALGRAGVVAGSAAVVAAALAVGPLAVALATGAVAVRPAAERTLPAIVTAEAQVTPGVGTLLLEPQSDGSLAATLTRGGAVTLDAASTFAQTRVTPDAGQVALAELAGNLASRGGYDPAPELARLGIRFVLLRPADPGGDAVHQRAAEALDAQLALEPIGDTALGSLWRAPASESPALPGPGPAAVALAIAQGIVIVATALLALPTGARRRATTVVDAPHAPEGRDDVIEPLEFEDDFTEDARG